MICDDIWHKYHEWYFEIVTGNLRQFRNFTSGIYAKYHVQIMLLFVYTNTHKRFVIFTFSYFKLSWNTTALSQSNCRNFSWSSMYNKDNGGGLLFKAIFRHRICIMSSVPTDAKEHGLKLEKVGPTFSCFNAMPVKIIRNVFMVSSPW